MSNYFLVSETSQTAPKMELNPLSSHCVFPFINNWHCCSDHPCPFPHHLGFPHSIWILSPKFILNPLPSLHLHWPPASTVVQTITSYLDQPPNQLPTSVLTLFTPVHSGYCCKNNHKLNDFTSLFNHFSGFPDILLCCAWSGPCLLFQFHVNILILTVLQWHWSYFTFF